MSVGRKFSKHLIQPPRVAAEETGPERGRPVSSTTHFVSEEPRRSPGLQLSLHLAFLLTPSTYWPFKLALEGTRAQDYEGSDLS